MLLEGVYGQVPAGQEKPVGRIDSNSQHLLKIINEILDITRIEAGRMPVHVSRFDLANLVEEILTELAPLLSRAELRTKVEVSPRPLEISTDRQKVKQIVVNLLSNAVKFSSGGHLQLAAAQKGDLITISVTDDGAGIAPENLEKVFEAFWQMDASPSRAHAGTGLGLAICKQLASVLGGRIELTSALGHGSTFKLIIPRETEA
jgi:signal transduction histidine kinase